MPMKEMISADCSYCCLNKCNKFDRLFDFCEVTLHIVGGVYNKGMEDIKRMGLVSMAGGSV